MSKFQDLSEIQMKMYQSICGYDYVPNTLKGKFMTEYPSRDFGTKVSPWIFEFDFHLDTGYFFCVMHHRMTNSQNFGWDYEGNKLDYELREEVFPTEWSSLISPQNKAET